MLPETILTFLELHHIPRSGIVIACSGGIDSTALLLAAASLRSRGYEITCGHVNHHLRGQESDEDEQFVRVLCRRLDIPLETENGALRDEAVRRAGI